MQKLDMVKAEGEIRRWGESLSRKCRVYLFGSRCNGTSTDSSDLDIAVEFEDTLFGAELYLMWHDNHRRWESFLTQKIGVKVDLQLCDGERSPTIARALEQGSKIIFENM